ncbi:MAG: type VI secretion system tip protein TssI/VgrG [Byssovorax sp.]
MTLMALTVGGAAMSASSVRGHSALSELFRFEVTAIAREAKPPAEIVGKPFELTLSDRFERSVVVRGVVMEVERVGGTGGGGAFLLTLGPEVEPLTVGRDSRVFQEMSAVDIVKKVLDKAGIPASNVDWQLLSDYPKRHYTAQQRESDWAFVCRLMEEEGIYYYFELGDDATKLVFRDDSTGAPEIDGGAEIPFRDDPGMRATRDNIARVVRRQAIAPGKVRLRDYSFEKPKLVLDAEAGDGTHEIYDFPGRFSTPGDGKRRAQTRLEALRARVSVTSGETWTTRLRTGLVFELTDHPIEFMNGRYLVDALDIEVSESRGGGEESLTSRFTAIPAATPFRPPQAAVTQATRGPETGVVSGASGKEIDPDASGRVRVQFYWDREGARDDKASTWMRVGQVALGGSMILPRIGWDVLVDHHEGDVDDPFVVTHLYDGQFPVPYALPANKTRTAWQTATTPGGGSTNEMRFEDKKGSEEMFFNASKDLNVKIGDKRSEKIGVNETVEIGSNLDVKIGSNLKVGIGASQTTSIGASESITVSGNRSVDVVGAETASIGASRTVTVKGMKLEANAGRTLTVGGSMMASSLLGVSRMVLGSLSVSVGGSWISAAATGLANLTGGAGAETVGGAKIQAAAKNVTTSVKGAAAETVGGAYVIAAGGSAGETATGSLTVNVGGALLGNAPKIVIEASSEISIMVGGSSLTIKSSSVEVKAPLVASPAATLKKSASSIHHN